MYLKQCIDTLIGRYSQSTRHTALRDPVLGARRSSDVGCGGHRNCEVTRGAVDPFRICSIGSNHNTENYQTSDTTPRAPSLPSDGRQLDDCRRPQDGGQGTSLLHWRGGGVGAPAYISRGPDTVPMVGAGLHHTISSTHQAAEQFVRLRLAILGLGIIAQCHGQDGHSQHKHIHQLHGHGQEGHRQHNHIHQLQHHSDLRLHYHHHRGELHGKYHRAKDRRGSVAAVIGQCTDHDPCGHDARVGLLDGW